MKKRTRFLFHIILIALCIFGIGNYSFGQEQERLNIKAGFGIPELINVGIRYQLNQFQLGIYIGGYPIDNSRTLTYSGDISYHFGGHSKLSERRPWYLRSGLTLLRDESETFTTKELYLNLRIGRDINLSKKFGLEIDFETAFLLFHKKSRKEPSDNWYDTGTDEILQYIIGFGLYYRL